MNKAIKKMLPVWVAFFHKGTYGKLTCVTGSSKYGGAVALSSVSALKAGTCIVRLVSVETAKNIMECIPEVFSHLGR